VRNMVDWVSIGWGVKAPNCQASNGSKPVNKGGMEKPRTHFQGLVIYSFSFFLWFFSQPVWQLRDWNASVEREADAPLLACMEGWKAASGLKIDR